MKVLRTLSSSLSDASGQAAQSMTSYDWLTAIRQHITDELSTINSYAGTVAFLRKNGTPDATKAADQVERIIAEEQNHVGEFQAILEWASGAEALNIQEGHKEFNEDLKSDKTPVEEILDKPSTPSVPSTDLDIPAPQSAPTASWSPSLDDAFGV